MKTTDVLVQCLENEGVEYVFGIIGTETLDLADSLSRSKQIQWVNVRHEQGAAFMADVYGRLSKKAGVCLSTLGPGATNLLTGIASAHLDHSPVVALIGQAGVERQHPESHQFVDMVRVLEPITKWSTQIKTAQSVPTTIRKAFRIAQLEKPGSVAIILPENFSTQMIPNTPLPVTPLPNMIPSDEAIQTAKMLIEQHKKPFIVMGNGICRHDASREIQTIIDALKVPTVHSFMAKGVLAKEHPQNYFTFGFNENDMVLSGIDEADLLIVIGFDFVEKLPKEWNKKKFPILHIDSLPAEVHEYYPVKAELVGDIKKILNCLSHLGLPNKSWAPAGNLKEQLKSAYNIIDHQNLTDVLPFTIENILNHVENMIPDHTIVISDVGAHKVSIARTYHPKKPNQVIISNGLASMGISLPGAIGAKLAVPDSLVICITGDGGALMNFAEIETAKRLGLSFMIIIINDSMLKLEVQQMDKKFGKSYGANFQNPDFLQLAASFGIKSMRANNLVEFKKHFNETITLDEMVLIDVVLS
ncbi:acetolactate synthase large subunit [Bacillus sp. BRMEA1]|nr:acetolactate synthase large subunit [Neobacillus endophyticus]